MGLASNGLVARGGEHDNSDPNREVFPELGGEPLDVDLHVVDRQRRNLVALRFNRRSGWWRIANAH